MEGRRPDGSFGVLWLTPQATEMTEQDWNFPEGRFLSYALGPIESGQPTLLIVFNAAPEEVVFKLPALDHIPHWTVLLETGPHSRASRTSRRRPSCTRPRAR